VAEGNDFALELVVGIKDMFTQKAKQIDAEVNKLDKDTTALQKTCDDVAAYNKATEAMKKMGEASDTSAADMKQQEKVVDDLAKSLKKAGVDVSNITREEQRLTRQMKETNTELKKRSGFKDLITGGITAVASHGLLKAFMAAGDQMAKIQLLMRNQSNLSEAEIGGDQGRKFRTAMTQKYGVHAGESAGTQTWFNRQNQLNGKQNEAATAASLHLGNLMQGQVGQEEINRAMTQLIAGGTKPEKAASLLYNTFLKGRGDAGDLMDAVQEYYTNLHSRGVSAEQFFAAMIQGTTEGKVFSYDKIGDSLKETFAARLTDPTVMAGLLGGGKKAGVIDQMKDGKPKYDLRAAILKFQKDLSENKNTVGDVANIYGQLAKVGKVDPAALRNISETIGGTMLTEDSATDAAAALNKALSNPNGSVGDAQANFDSHQQLLTQAEQAEANKAAITESLSNASADATKHLQGFTDALTTATTKLTSLSSDHPMAGEIAAGLFGGTLLAGKVLGAGRMMRGAGSLFGISRLGGGLARGGRSLLLGGGMMLADTKLGSALSGTLNIAEKGAGLLGRGVSGGLGYLGKAARLGGRWLGPVGDIAIGGLSAYDDYQKGDMRSAAGDVGGTLGGMGAGAAAGAAVGSVVPVIGTAIGGVVGGALGYWGGDKLGESLYDWIKGDDDKHDNSQQQMQTMVNNLPSNQDLTTSTDGGYVPNVQLSFNPAIKIDAMTANPDDISKALAEALRQSTPEMMQQLEDTLAQLMLNNDHQRPSN
jgi:gas vesicle protein